MNIYLICYFAISFMCMASLCANAAFRRGKPMAAMDAPLYQLALGRKLLRRKEKSAVFKRDVPFFLCCLFLLYLVCCRNVSVGADTLVYSHHFLSVLNFSFLESVQISDFEPGFVLLYKLIALFGRTANAYVFIMGLISLLPAFYIIKKYSSFPCLSLCILYVMYFDSMEYLNRLWCAILITMFSYEFVIQRKFAPFFFTILLACMFHRTAAAFFIVYFLYAAPVNVWTILAFMFGSVVIGLAGGRIVSFMRIFARVAYDDVYNGGVTLLIVLWAYVIVIFLFGGKSVRTGRYKLYFLMLLFGVFIQPLSFTLSVVTRLGQYFVISLIFLFPMIFWKIFHQGYNRPYIFAGLSFLLGYLLLYFYVTGIPEGFQAMTFS